MKTLAFLLPLLALGAAHIVCAELKPGAELIPYEIHNTATGKNYCQMCNYGSKPATVAAYGKLNDARFWSDLEKLQALQNKYQAAGFFAQVLDSTDDAAIQAQARKHGVTFPVVYAKEADWDEVYQVNGVSRTVYYSKEFKMAWSSVGLDEKFLVVVEGQLGKDTAGIAR